MQKIWKIKNGGFCMKRVNKKVVASAVGIVLLMVVSIGGVQVWMNQQKAMRADLIVAQQEEKFSTSSVANSESETQYVDAPKGSTDEKVQENTPAQGDTTVIQNEDGSITAQRDWSMKKGEGDIVKDDANMASGGGDIALDENGVYHGEEAQTPTATVAPTQAPAPKPTAAPASQATAAPAPQPTQAPANTGAGNTGVPPGFENAIQGGANTTENSYSDGDWNKIVGTM